MVNGEWIYDFPFTIYDWLIAHSLQLITNYQLQGNTPYEPNHPNRPTLAD